MNDEVEDLKPTMWTRMAAARYNALYNAHPDCRDPDHPGCERCCEAAQGDTNE